ncbi:MAG: FtsX-like permease family protein, partial [Poseidonia sp.]
YKALWESEGASFSFPWLSTTLLFFLGWLIVLLTTFLPVRQASKIPPSAALRNL